VLKNVLKEKVQFDCRDCLMAPSSAARRDRRRSLR
jgi:hypothetical protein